MRIVAVVRPGATNPPARLAGPVADAFTVCFRRRGWKVEQVNAPITGTPDLVAGYGWREPMADAWARWPDRVLHVDGAFWGRNSHVKLALGGRWSPIVDRDYDDRRLRQFKVTAAPSRAPGPRVLICGMSAKAAISWGLDPEGWERQAARTLIATGAVVTYRPKPRWMEARRIDGATFEDSSRVSITDSFARVDAVATHHSNAAIDALASGLPVYAGIGLARALSVERLEHLPGAVAPDRGARQRFLCQVAWHQWTLSELSAGAWLKPPAPLSGLLDAEG